MAGAYSMSHSPSSNTALRDKDDKGGSDAVDILCQIYNRNSQISLDDITLFVIHTGR